MSRSTRDIFIALFALAAVGGGIYLYERHVTTTTPVTSLETGTTYKLTWTLPAGMDPATAVQTMQVGMSSTGWTNVSVTSSGGGTVVGTGTFSGASGPAQTSMIPGHVVVTKA
jgi:disulfide bond formation protein DsbB